VAFDIGPLQRGFHILGENDRPRQILGVGSGGAGHQGIGQEVADEDPGVVLCGNRGAIAFDERPLQPLVRSVVDSQVLLSSSTASTRMAVGLPTRKRTGPSASRTTR